MSDTIRLFIGTSETEDYLAEQVYLYSIYKNLPPEQEIEITFLRPSMFPNWDRRYWGTPFTCFRYAIPELCNFEGRALYTDVDMINFRDLTHLFNIDLEGKPFGMVWDAQQDNGKKGAELGVPRGWWCDSVILFDCEKAKPYMDSIKDMEEWSAKTSKSYKWEFGEKLNMPYKQESKEYIMPIDSRWNCFDGVDPAVVVPEQHMKDFWSKPQMHKDFMWQLHLTGLSYQPWHPRYNCFAKAPHWRQDLMEVWWEYANIIRQMKKHG